MEIWTQYGLKQRPLPKRPLQLNLSQINFNIQPIFLTLRLQNTDFKMTYRNYNDLRVDGEQTNSQNAITTLGEENKTCLKSCRLF